MKITLFILLRLLTPFEISCEYILHTYLPADKDHIRDNDAIVVSLLCIHGLGHGHVCPSLPVTVLQGQENIHKLGKHHVEMNPLQFL